MDTKTNELIALNGQLAFKSGQKDGFDKAILILKNLKTEFNGNDYSLRTIAKAVQILEKERNGQNAI